MQVLTISLKVPCFISLLSPHCRLLTGSPVSVTISIAWLTGLAKTLAMSSLLQLTDSEEKLQMVERREKNIQLFIIRKQHPT